MAFPADTAWAAQPGIGVGSSNATVPVGVAWPGLVTATLALRVTTCPVMAGVAEEVTVEVVVAALSTVWVSAEDVDPPKFESPAYTTVMV